MDNLRADGIIFDLIYAVGDREVKDARISAVNYLIETKMSNALPLSVEEYLFRSCRYLIKKHHPDQLKLLTALNGHLDN